MDKMGEEEKGHLNQYNKYATNLRQWFVGYGIGAVVLIITQKDIFIKYVIVILCLLALSIISQIILSGLNKYNQWLCYHSEYCTRKNKPVCNAKLCNFAERSSDKILFDFILDATSLLCLVASFILMMLCL